MDDKTVTTKPQQTAMATMPPADRAYLALSEKHDEQALIELAGKYRDATEIKDKTDYAMIMRGGIELQKVRVAIEKTGKAARQDANDFRTAVLTEQKRLIDIIEPEEKRLRQLRADYDAEVERKAEEARMLEQRRISDITDRIRSIEKQVDGLLGADAASIRLRLESVQSIECSEVTFAEFSEEASDVQARVCIALETALQERSEFETRQAENERIAREQAERQAELDRQAEEQRKQQQAEQDRIDAHAAELKRKQDEIDAKIKAEEDRKLAEERAEAQRVAEEKAKLEQEKRDREEAERKAAEEQAERERQEALRPEKDRLIDWLKQLRFIDGVELKDPELVKIQSSVLHDLKMISETHVKIVENA